MSSVDIMSYTIHNHGKITNVEKAPIIMNVSLMLANSSNVARIEIAEIKISMIIKLTLTNLLFKN